MYLQTPIYYDHIHEANGLLYISNGITLYIADNRLRDGLGSNIYTVEGSKVIFPPTSYVEQVMTIKGDVYGLEHLYTRGTTALYYSGSAMGNIGTPLPGKYHLSTMTVLNQGKIQLIDDDYTTSEGLDVFTQYFHVQHSSTVEVTYSGSLVSWIMDVEKAGIITGDGKGYEKATGPGAGTTCSNDAGGGAAHGGHGGNGYNSCGSYCTGSSSTYDDKCLPWTAGSGGGSCSHGNAGSGGSALRVVSSNAMFLEGQVHMKGIGSGAGGAGSGGSVWMDSEIIEGWGILNADGGDGAGTECACSCYLGGCCGSHYSAGGGGGRIRTFTGNYTHKVLKFQRSVSGGNGISPATDGSSGTLCEASANLCNGRGTFLSGSCTCNSGFVGSDCQYYCDPTTTCSGHGTCSHWGTCQCDSNYVGHRCDSQCHANTTCSGHGTCTSIGTCICDPCYHGDDCSKTCNGQGQCVGGECQCDDCHLGRFCESECNDHGNCNSLGTCTCTDNWQEDKCTRPGCPSKTSDECSGHGICMAGSGKCYCEPGWAGKS